MADRHLDDHYDELAQSGDPVDAEVARRQKAKATRAGKGAAPPAGPTLLSLIEQRVGKLKQKGDSWVGACPLHSSKSGESLVVWPLEGRWWCSSCKRGGGAAAWQRLMDGPSIDLPTETTTEAWPEPLAPEAFHGLAGALANAIIPVSEADPVAILIHLLVAFGSAVGSHPHVLVQHDRHPARLFGVLVGASAKGRKGSSWSAPRAVLTQASPAWAGHIRNGGLSSGEGLIWQVRDPVFERVPVKEGGNIVGYEEVEKDHGVDDKRLLVVEEEFAQALAVMRREGNTLSTIIRSAWDHGDLYPLTKNNQTKATGAHISIIGHITRDELRARMDETHLLNGFGNRFLWVAVRRGNILPDGGGLDDANVNYFATQFADAITRAQSIGQVRRDAQATELWHTVYPELSADRPGLLGAALARAEAQVLRLSLVYALLDGSEVITEAHILAALAVWDYCEASARWIFGGATGDATADRILAALKAAGSEGLDGAGISDIFGRNVTANRLHMAMQTLLNRGLVKVQQVATGGRPRTLYLLP